MLGGHHTGNWDADFTAKPPKFFGSGSVSKVAMAQVAALMHDPWATGTLEGQYTLGIAGLDAAALRDSATGSVTFKWTGGSLRHIVLEGKAAPLVVFQPWRGRFSLRNGTLTCEDCKLLSGGELFNVSGSASFTRNLDLQLKTLWPKRPTRSPVRWTSHGSKPCPLLSKQRCRQRAHRLLKARSVTFERRT